jgi:hypothetical protein
MVLNMTTMLKLIWKIQTNIIDTGKGIMKGIGILRKTMSTIPSQQLPELGSPLKK